MVYLRVNCNYYSLIGLPSVIRRHCVRELIVHATVHPDRRISSRTVGRRPLCATTNSSIAAKLPAASSDLLPASTMAVNQRIGRQLSGDATVFG